MQQRPPEQAGQPDPMNPQHNAAQPDLVPPIQRAPTAGEGELVPPAQSVRPRAPDVPPRPVQPSQPIAPNAPNAPNASNATEQQREPSGNMAPLLDQPYGRQAAADPRVSGPLSTSAAPGAGATAGMVPPVQPVAPQAAGAAPASAAGHAHEMRAREDVGRFVTLSSLMHLPIVDLGTGRRLGRVDNIILSSDHRTVEAYTSHGGFLSGTKAFPARGATIGQDAIVLPPGALERFDKRSLRGLPLAGPMTGTRLLSDTGRVLGTVTDIRMDPATADVVSYEINPEDRSLLDRLRHRAAVLPVAAVQRRGADAWIVAEDDARQHLGG